jgi:hypothetical protein
MSEYPGSEASVLYATKLNFGKEFKFTKQNRDFRR